MPRRKKSAEENDAVTDKVQREEKEPLLFADFEAGKSIAAPLIATHHPEIASARIIYLCRNRAPMRGGHPVAGTVKKASPIERHLGRPYFGEGDETEPDYIVVISLDVWNQMDPAKRTALIDHLLTRCVGEENEKSGEMKFKIRSPNASEFAEVAARQGAWNEDLADLSNALALKAAD